MAATPAKTAKCQKELVSLSPRVSRSCSSARGARTTPRTRKVARQRSTSSARRSLTPRANRSAQGTPATSSSGKSAQSSLMAPDLRMNRTTAPTAKATPPRILSHSAPSGGEVRSIATASIPAWPDGASAASDPVDGAPERDRVEPSAGVLSKGDEPADAETQRTVAARPTAAEAGDPQARAAEVAVDV